MTTQNLPGTNAARQGTGDADLTIMIAAHDAFRRDLTRLARTAGAAHDPARHGAREPRRPGRRDVPRARFHRRRVQVVGAHKFLIPNGPYCVPSHLEPVSHPGLGQ